MEKQTLQLTGIKYYACVYLTNGTVHLNPRDTEAEAQELIDSLKNNEKYQDTIVKAHIIKRNLDNPKYKNGLCIL